MQWKEIEKKVLERGTTGMIFYKFIHNAYLNGYENAVRKFEDQLQDKYAQSVCQFET